MTKSASPSYTLTVTADDNTESPPGDLIGRYNDGDREDSPGESITITIIVANSCPTDISRAVCQAPAAFTNVFWTGNTDPSPPKNELAVFGASNLTMTVSGGNPPNGAQNWNGLYIEEEVRFVPGDPGTANPARFNTSGFGPGNCVATSDGFVVGTPGLTSVLGISLDPPCKADKKDNVFYDLLTLGKYGSKVYSGPDGKTAKCYHDYLCDGDVIETFQDVEVWSTVTVNNVERNPVRIQ